MICRENVILYDRYGNFMAIRDRLVNNIKVKGFLSQCVEFSKLFGSENGRKWERILMQFKYNNRRKKNILI